MRVLEPVYLFLGVSLLLYLAVDAQWLLGCYNEDLSDRNLWHRQQYEQQQLTPLSCVLTCGRSNYTYAALQNGTLCFCGNDNASLQHVKDGECTMPCSGNHSLFCGGLNSSQLYSVAVPIISSSNATEFKFVKTNESFKVTAWVQASPGEKLHLLSEYGADTINVKWSLEGKVVNASVLAWKGTSFKETIAFHVQRPGRYGFCVNISNLFSKAEHCWTTEVLDPVTGLQVIPAFNDSQITNSSRIPINEEVFIKVLLTSGSNVRFKFDFGEGGRHLDVSGSKTYESSYLCVRAWRKYKKCGAYNLNITAFNAISRESLHFPKRFETEFNIEELIHVRINTTGYRWHLELGKHADEQQFWVDVRTSVASGCHLSYSWIVVMVKDNKEYNIHSGREVKFNHSFDKVNSSGEYKVMVTFGNKLWNLSKSASVFVHKKLEGVSLHWKTCKNSGKRLCIRFTAMVTPQSEKDLGTMYTWFPGTNGTNIPPGQMNPVTFYYENVGRCGI